MNSDSSHMVSVECESFPAAHCPQFYPPGHRGRISSAHGCICSLALFVNTSILYGTQQVSLYFSQVVGRAKTQTANCKVEYLCQQITSQPGPELPCSGPLWLEELCCSIHQARRKEIKSPCVVLFSAGLVIS